MGMRLERLLRLMHGVWRLSRGQTLEARIMALDTAGAVCLVRPGPGAQWQLPGGPVEAGESASQAVARALAEQGLAASNPRLRALYRGAAGEADQIGLYEARNASFAPSPGAARGAFFAADALPATAAVTTRRAVAELIGPPPAARE